MSQLTSGQRLATGTGASRRRLTEAEAQAGCLPERMTAAEWTAAHVATQRYATRLLSLSLSALGTKSFHAARLGGLALQAWVLDAVPVLGDQATATTLATKANVPYGTVIRAVRRLVAAGKLEQGTTTANHGRPAYVYRVVAA